ncbi:MAG: hypothetical protein BroJett040_01350 [Oligoflexia bacterium]|nr:MAG: hypothetical protein BroJett040_01350 [Oligoflexia bacterium]
MIQSAKSENQVTLQSNLSQFGLNPIDWKIIHEEGRIYRIENITDADFYFVGIKKPLQNSWSLMELASI